MKLYYGPAEPDLDDLEGPLGQMIVRGVVPKGCKLGGFLVEKEHQEGRDPCESICPHDDRDTETGCGGRIRTGAGFSSSAASLERIGNQASDARKLLRVQQRKVLDRLVAEKQRR